MFLTKVPRSKYYQIVYFVKGRRTTHSTKKVDEKDALKYLEKFQKSFSNPSGAKFQKTLSTPKSEKIEKSLSIFKSEAIEKPIIKNTLTLSKFKDEFLEYAKPVKSKSYFTSIAFAFKQFVSFCGDIPLDKVDTRTVDKFINSTFACTKRGAHQYYRTLKAAFNKALEWEYISVNPFVKVKFPRMAKSFPVFMSEDELLIILSNTPFQYLKDIFTVAFYTGLRLGELTNMRWNWLDFFQSGGQITVKCSNEFMTKSKKERNVPMCEKVKTILINRFYNCRHQTDDVVFYYLEGKKLLTDSISGQFKKAVRKSQLNDKIHFHTLRHSFASLLAQKGVSLYVIKELLGHEDLATTQIYSQLQQQNL